MALRRRHTTPVLLRDAAIAVCVAVAIAVYSWFMWKRLAEPHEGPPSALFGDARIMQEGFRDRCGRPTQGDEAIVVNVLHAEGLSPWISDAAERFMSRCPNTQLNLSSLEDMEAVREVLSGSADPVLWVPSNSIAVDYLQERWDAAGRGIPLLLEEGAPLLRSPMVLFIWEERYRVLTALLEPLGVGATPWARSLCAALPPDAPVELTGVRREAMVPGTWLEWKRARFGEAASPHYPDDLLRQWGQVQIEHSSPTRTVTGLAALYLMAADFARSRGEELGAADATARGLEAEQAAFGRWIRRCEAGLDYPLASAQLLIDRMFHVGSKYDGVVVPERLVFELLDRINEHGPRMQRAHVAYPEVTVIDDHPAVLMWPGDPEMDDERASARRFVTYLRSEDQQRRAVERGFRPTHPQVLIREHDAAENPFLRLRSFGVEVEPSLRPLPRIGGAALRRLVETWEDATGRN